MSYDAASDTRAAAEWVKLDGLAEWFGGSVPTMRRKLPELYSEGFPLPCAAVGKWYLPACREWALARQQSGQFATGGDPLMEALDVRVAH